MLMDYYFKHLRNIADKNPFNKCFQGFTAIPVIPFPLKKGELIYN
jgi:hypothetical protein